MMAQPPAHANKHDGADPSLSRLSLSCGFGVRGGVEAPELRSAGSSPLGPCGARVMAPPRLVRKSWGHILLLVEEEKLRS